MTETKESEQTCNDEVKSIDNDPPATKETEMVEENHKEDKKEVDVNPKEDEKEVDVNPKEDEKEVEANPKEDKKEDNVNPKEDKKEDDVNPEEDEKEIDEGKVDHEAKNEDEDDEKMKDSEAEDGEPEKKSEHSLKNASDDGRKELHMDCSSEKSFDKDVDSSVDEVENDEDLQTVNVQSNVDDTVANVLLGSLANGIATTQASLVKDEKECERSGNSEENGVKLDICDTIGPQSGDCETISPIDQSSSPKFEHVKEDKVKDDVTLKEHPADADIRHPSNFLVFDTDTSGGGDAGTIEEQAAFIVEIRKFYKERSLDFKPPKFYGEPLNLLKLWRAVLRLGGYDKVTACKYWRQIGESFKPPKTCTTISFTFRIFYEKALLDYERYRTSGDGAGLLASFAEPLGAENQVILQASGPGPGRVRRDSAARAIQGWHSQRTLDNGEDKHYGPVSKKEKPLSSLGGGQKRKKPFAADDAPSTRTKLPKVHSDATVIDIGSPADWVKINVQATRDCYEVYALVPGLLREEVRVQSDPAGRLVISGEPENPDNPWDVTPFKKVVSLPSRIDPHQTSAVVTLHGQLFVRVPFE